MKLGLYGGGFKPFTTGHFAKLADAIRDNDKVILFYGIQQQEPPEFYKRSNKKKGIKAGDRRPPRQDFRKIGDTGREYNENIGSKVFKVYEKAFERIPEIEIIPVYSQDIDQDFDKKMTPLNQIFKVLDKFAANPALYEKVSIYGDRESLPRFINYSPIQSLKDSGKIQFGGAIPSSPSDYEGEAFEALMAAGEKEAQSALRDYYLKMDQDISDEELSGRQAIRGTDVRMHASTEAGAEEAMRFLPPFLSQDEKMEIIRILQGEVEREVENVQETFILPIITDSTILRAAARFEVQKSRKSRLVESSSTKKGEDHILGFTEDMNLTFENLRSIINDVFWGRIEHIEEKMDGQNFTFTVNDNGELRVFGKGVSATTLDKGGKNLSDIESAYSGKENLLDAFSSAYSVVEKYILGKDIDTIRRLFKNGRVVVEGQIMTPINPNTIPYTENHVRFVRPFTPDNIDIDQEAYSDIFEDTDIEIQDKKGRSWSFGPVPKLEQTQVDAEEISSKISELESDIENLISGISPPPKTVGDYASYAMESYIENVAPEISLEMLTPDQKRRALERLATGNKSLIGKREIGDSWSEFQKFEKLRTAHVAAAIADLEKIIQKLGTYFFDTLEFALATNEDVVSDLAAEVEKIKRAREADQIVIKNADSGDISDLIDTSWATKLDSSLARVEQMDMFKKAVEGVVLRMPDENGQQIVRKLTGMFTPIHRLVSLFKYPDRYSRQVLSIEDEQQDLTQDERAAINEILSSVLRKINEGGNAFKDSEGNIVTSSEKIPRDVANRILSDLKVNLLDPLGLKFEPVGSTDDSREGRPEAWQPSRMLGDIDILVELPDTLVGETEDQRQQYRDPSLQGLDKKERQKRKSRQRKIERGLASDTHRKDALYVALRNHSYLSDEIVKGVPRVIDSSDGSRILVQDKDTGELYQVDVDLKDSDRSFDDERWERSGGGHGTAKGLYRNLLLSFIAKLKSQEETADLGKNVKITLAIGKGLRKQVSGEDDITVTDPDEYLPILGIDARKNEVRSFEQLVDYMIKNPNDVFLKALAISPQGGQIMPDTFDRYVGRPQMSDQNEIAFSYIRNAIGDSSLQKENYKKSIRNIVRRILSEGTDSPSDFPFVKIVWSEKLKIFSSGKWNLWNERASATADGGKDPEGAEKAVAAMENLIYLGHEGYAVASQEDGGVLIQGKGINAKLDPDEAVEYIIGIRTSSESEDQRLPDVRIRHVAGTKPYDLELASTGEALEVKKMGSRNKLSKLGSATGRLFDRHVKIIRPLRSAGQIAQRFIEEGSVVDEDGVAIIRQINSAPDSFEINDVADAVEIIDYFFNKIRFGNSAKELPGVMIKVEGGQIGAGMARRIKMGDLLNIEDHGNLFEICKKALNSTLGEYSPAKERSKDRSSDSVDVKAFAGPVDYEGKVSLDYFYDELIYKLFDSDSDSSEIDEDLITSYTKSVELIADIFGHLIKINESQGSDVFDDFISDLHYGGFYGVAQDHYYSVPCDSKHLDVYGTTQGFRAVLEMREMPPAGPSIPDVKIKNVPEEEEVDLEIDLENEDPDDTTQDKGEDDRLEIEDQQGDT